MRCPKCDFNASNQAKFCNKCGYKLDAGNEKDIIAKRGCSSTHKNNIFKLLVITNIVFFVLICCLIGYIVLNNPKLEDDSPSEEVYKSDESEIKSKYNLFKNSSLNKADPYGLSNEYNILGKDINEILVGYKEGKDYEITQNEYFNSYKFTRIIKGYASDLYDANLSIYTSANDDTISIIEYHYKASSALWNIHLSDVKRSLTKYYDVDPAYDYLNGYDTVEISKDEFEKLLDADVISIYHITWESDKGRAIFTIENLHEEADDDWYVSFTK